jgi:poly-gamma-glutamate capsule biosynthesis protein CapA/YwtB (metallophosphatase superfamily)
MNIRLLIAGLLSALVLGSCLYQNSPRAEADQAPAAPLTHDTLCIAAVGDMMLGTSYPNNSSLPLDGAKNSFKTILNDLRHADVTMGNLEGNLLDSGAPAHFKLHQLSKAYLFRMPTAYGRVFKDAGFNVLSLANNHMADFGDRGRQSTMQVLDSLGIKYGGQLSHPSAIFTVKGVTYGFCAFAPNSQTLPILDLPNAARIIRDLKSRCDIVIVSFHGGGEGPNYEHVTKQPESYIGEKRGNVHAFAHTVIDAGADMVLGNGPHVCRAMELYKNRLIAYSLGNFCTYKSVSVDGVCGLAPLLKVYTNKKGEFLNGRIIALKQTHADGLMRDSSNKVIARIKYLTNVDFPDSGLNIADDGVITLLPQTVLVAGGQD